MAYGHACWLYWHFLQKRKKKEKKMKNMQVKWTYIYDHRPQHLTTMSSWWFKMGRPPVHFNLQGAWLWNLFLRWLSYKSSCYFCRLHANMRYRVPSNILFKCQGILAHNCFSFQTPKIEFSATISWCMILDRTATKCLSCSHISWALASTSKNMVENSRSIWPIDF